MFDHSFTASGISGYSFAEASTSGECKRHARVLPRNGGIPGKDVKEFDKGRGTPTPGNRRGRSAPPAAQAMAKSRPTGQWSEPITSGMI